MANTPLMNLQVLSVGPGGDSETTLWNKLITNFSTIDSHTHAAGDGSRITTGALNIDADLSLNSNQITEVRSVLFNNLTTDVTATGTLYIKNNELVFRDGANNVVPITTGGALDFSGVGNISGLVAPASASYSSVFGEFSFFKDSNVYAEIASANLLLYPLNGATTFAVNLAAPTLLETYTITWPTASPAGNNYMLQFTSGGVGSFVPGLESAGVSAGQIVFATDDHTVDGVTILANELLLGNGAGNPFSGKLTNDYVDVNAAIAGTKISPNFGSQNIVTTGTADIGATTADSLESQSTLVVATAATFNGTVNITDSNDSLTVAPPATFGSSVGISGAATLSSTLAVTGATTLNSTLTVASTTTINGAANLNGNTIIGNATADTVTFTARAASDLVPATDSLRSLGTTSLRWANLYADTVTGTATNMSTISTSSLSSGTGTFSGSITVSTGGATGGGITIADDGDMVDLNDGFLSMRFSQGVRVYSANGGGSEAVTLFSSGQLKANAFVETPSGWFTGQYSGSLSQGAVIAWNQPGGSGRTAFMNHKGAGGGGFEWYNSTGTGGNPSNIGDYTSLMTLAENGNLSTAGDIQVANTKRFILGDDGDIADLGDGAASMRFGAGVKVFSGNAGGSQVHHLRNDGHFFTTDITAGGTLNIPLRYQPLAC